jgi:anthranilate synthase component 2
MKVLIVDCYDSFTFNLYQQVGKLGGNPVVMTCDTPLEQLKKCGCDRIILSPGPGTPHDSGVCLEVLETMSRTIPTLGVCLGHQAICTAFGGEVVRAGHLMHGKTHQSGTTGREFLPEYPRHLPRHGTTRWLPAKTPCLRICRFLLPASTTSM